MGTIDYEGQELQEPYIRESLLELWRESMDEYEGNHIIAWYRMSDHPVKSGLYKKGREKDDMVKASWAEVSEIISAALLYTIQKFGPDRIAGCGPRPKDAMLSAAAGQRFLSLLGGVILAEEDSYQDLPASWKSLAWASDWQDHIRMLSPKSYYARANNVWPYEGLESLEDYALAARLGRIAAYPQFDMNPEQIDKQAFLKGAMTDDETIEFLVENLKKAFIKFSGDEPASILNLSRILILWRNNDSQQETAKRWAEMARAGKLDLIVSLESVMGSSAALSDIVLPVGKLTEEGQGDWEIFRNLAASFSKMAEDYMPAEQKDMISLPIAVDSAAGVLDDKDDWQGTDVPAIVGKNLPQLVFVERDYSKIYDKFIACQP